MAAIERVLYGGSGQSSDAANIPIEGTFVMIVAIYARESTEQHNVSNDEKSVTRQIEHAKAYAARKAGRSPRT